MRRGGGTNRIISPNMFVVNLATAGSRLGSPDEYCTSFL